LRNDVHPGIAEYGTTDVRNDRYWRKAKIISSYKI
jgi:hypothetical protein